MAMRLCASPEWAIATASGGASSTRATRASITTYEHLTPTVVIVWLTEALSPPLGRLHTVVELRDRDGHWRLTDHLAFHLLELPSLSPSLATGYDAQVERWARFLNAHDSAELDQLASEDPIMSLAKDTLDQLSQDPTAQRLALERADAAKLYQFDLAASRKEARKEARQEARAELLLEQLGLRFGPLSEATRARVQAATAAELDTWVERVLSAQTLDEVLAP